MHLQKMVMPAQTKSRLSSAKPLTAGTTTPNTLTIFLISLHICNLYLHFLVNQQCIPNEGIQQPRWFQNKGTTDVCWEYLFCICSKLSSQISMFQKWHIIFLLASVLISVLKTCQSQENRSKFCAVWLRHCFVSCHSWIYHTVAAKSHSCKSFHSFF